MKIKKVNIQLCSCYNSTTSLKSIDNINITFIDNWVGKLPDTACWVPVWSTCLQYGQASPHGNVSPTSVCIASPYPGHTASSQIRGCLSAHATL